MTSCIPKSPKTVRIVEGNYAAFDYEPYQSRKWRDGSRTRPAEPPCSRKASSQGLSMSYSDLTRNQHHSGSVKRLTSIGQAVWRNIRKSSSTNRLLDEGTRTNALQRRLSRGSRYSPTVASAVDLRQSSRPDVVPNEDTWYRTCHICGLTVWEVKGLPTKRRYFCEVYLDQDLVAQTSSKQQTSDFCFWGESYQYERLAPVHQVSLCLYKDGNSRQSATYYGSLSIPADEIRGAVPAEKWFPVELSEKVRGKQEAPVSVRVQAHLMTLTILPQDYYSDLIKYLTENAVDLCRRLELVLKAKEKEDIASSMVKILCHSGREVSFLCQLIDREIDAQADPQLLFRSNSFGSKAMEAYIKLLGQDYLYTCLGELLQSFVKVGEDCEVDPNKLQNPQHLARNQRTLKMYTEVIWHKIVKSADDFPPELKTLFAALKKTMVLNDKGALAERLLSSCFFLRYICAAILSPSLFALVPEYPDEAANRKLTLIAKSLQALANQTMYDRKEAYMEFMNDEFIRRQLGYMKQFLYDISTPPTTEPLKPRIRFDIAKEMAIMQSHLQSGLARLQPTPELCDLDQIIHSLMTVEENPVFGRPPPLTNARPLSEYDNLSEGGTSSRRSSVKGSSGSGDGRSPDSALIKRDSMRLMKYIDDTASPSSSSDISIDNSTSVNSSSPPCHRPRSPLSSASSFATTLTMRSGRCDGSRETLLNDLSRSPSKTPGSRAGSDDSRRSSLPVTPKSASKATPRRPAHILVSPPLARIDDLSPLSPSTDARQPLRRTSSQQVNSMDYPAATSAGHTPRSSGLARSGSHQIDPHLPQRSEERPGVRRTPSHRIYLANAHHSEGHLDQMTKGSRADARRHTSWYCVDAEDFPNGSVIREEADDDDVDGLKQRLVEIEKRLAFSEQREREWRKKYEEVEPKLTKMLEVFEKLRVSENESASDRKMSSDIIRKQQERITSLEEMNATLMNGRYAVRHGHGQVYPASVTSETPVIYRESAARKNSMSESSDELVMDASSDQ